MGFGTYPHPGAAGYMKLSPSPGGGGQGWEAYSRSIIGLFGQQMGRPFWLWPSPTTDLPTIAKNGANEGALAYDDTLNTLTWYDGLAWQSGMSLTASDARYVKKAGDTMTGALFMQSAWSAAPGFEVVDTTAASTTSGGGIRLLGVKPTAADQRIAMVFMGALDSAAAIQNAAAMETFANENWGTLAGEGTYLQFSATLNGAFSRTPAMRVYGYGIVSLGSFASNIRTITATASAAANDYTILCDATAGAVVVNLPAAAGCPGRIYNVKKIDASVNSVTIDGNGAETVDGAATKATTTQYAGWTIQSNGTGWHIL